MQAIRTHYLGPTDTRGARIKATADGGSLTIPYPYENNQGEEAHRVAAEALRDRLGWDGYLVGGHLSDGSYAFVFLTEGLLTDVLIGPTSGAEARRMAATFAASGFRPYSRNA